MVINVLAVAAGCFIGYMTVDKQHRSVRPALTSFAVISVIVIVIHELV